MKISEIAPTKPKTPAQLRLDALKRQKAALQRRIDTERGSQLLRKAQQQS
jgi:hypothetical protein